MSAGLAAPTPPADAAPRGEAIRVRGLVQGVGFRPTVWRLARACGLTGAVLNDGDGVLIQAQGAPAHLDSFVQHLRAEAPPLARIDAIERMPAALPPAASFRIAESAGGGAHTGIVPDAATCPACLEDVLSPFSRRYRYPFTNCTHCGPRLSIIRAIPYDRAQTSMAEFSLCEDCRAEYEDPVDRRFHAQPNACHVCGPRVSLERLDGRAVTFESHSMLDAVDAVGSLLQKGEIVLIKGLGGFHLACDATQEDVVARLRTRKRRYDKPFALMARDLAVIERYCPLGDGERALLQSAEAPIVLLSADGPERLPEAVAPGLDTLGFMLPHAPLQHLILRRLDRPVVMTSGNASDEPQCIDDEDARDRLAEIADFALFHDREIVNRVDDSVVRVMAGAPRLLRRARGYAPAPLPLPAGFETAPDLLAMGGELKSCFALVKDGQAILSQHQGDLEDARTFRDYRHNLELYGSLFDHRPALIAIDRHPDYLSSKLGRERADDEGLPLIEVQHHHAHIASCLAENGVPLDTQPVLGVALDGLGAGADGTIWGGEFLRADYRGFERLGTFKPVAMLGGAQAIYEPWRNTYAHLMAEMGWDRFKMDYAALELCAFLESKPRPTLDAMLARGLNSPLASSCGRLFDAVAAAIGVCRERAGYEGQAAVALEALVDCDTLENESETLAYPFAIPVSKESGLPYIEPLALWQALLGDLILETPRPVMAARFHKGLARAIVAMVLRLTGEAGPRRVALSGGVFQNKVLLEQVVRRLDEQGYEVLTQSRVPANDGGLALGQAAIAAARACA